MVAKLERDGLSSDLETVSRLLEQRTQDEDPVGWLQFTARKNQLESELASFDAPTTGGRVALFFGGLPVVGSRGVFADFGGKALDQFQTLVSLQLAASEGPVGTRGPIPQRERAQLIVSNVMRGSFGFALEEATPEGQLLNTPTKVAIADIVDVLSRTTSPDEEAFGIVTDSIDPRVLSSVTSFVKLLDDAGANLKIVDDTREVTISRDAIHLAKGRTESLRIGESVKSVTGVLYILPDAKRFELHPADEDHYRGSIDFGAIDMLIDDSGEARPGIVGTVRRVRLSVREVRSPTGGTRYSYRLLNVEMSDVP